jgi:hypothetical protein
LWGDCDVKETVRKGRKGQKGQDKESNNTTSEASVKGIETTRREKNKTQSSLEMDTYVCMCVWLMRESEREKEDVRIKRWGKKRASIK